MELSPIAGALGFVRACEGLGLFGWCVVGLRVGSGAAGLESSGDGHLGSGNRLGLGENG